MKRIITAALTICMLCQPISVAAAPVTESKTEKNVTNYKLSDDSVVIAVSKAKKLQVHGVNADDTVTWKVSNPSIASVDQNGNVVGKNVGTTEVVAEVGETEVTGEVVITNPTLEDSSGIIAKNETTTVQVNGISEESQASVSYNHSAVTASISNGTLRIKPKKVGFTTVSVEVDGKTTSYTATVTTRTALKAIAKARKAKGSRYSQPKRMRKGYYDCSSLIWRIYKPYKVYFGKKKYAPTAAMEAKNMKKNKKVVSYKRVKASKLLPGDVIFYSYTRNGRYRNISHVALYIGDGRIIHAANRRVGVIEANYKYSKSIKMIARPTK